MPSEKLSEHNHGETQLPSESKLWSKAYKRAHLQSKQVTYICWKGRSRSVDAAYYARARGEVNSDSLDGGYGDLYRKLHSSSCDTQITALLELIKGRILRIFEDEHCPSYVWLMKLLREMEETGLIDGQDYEVLSMETAIRERLKAKQDIQSLVRGCFDD